MLYNDCIIIFFWGSGNIYLSACPGNMCIVYLFCSGADIHITKCGCFAALGIQIWFESFLIFILWSDSSFASQQLLTPSQQPNANWPSLVAGSSFGPSVTNRQGPSTSASSQLTLHPIRAGYSASRFPTNVSAARSPIINTISLPVENLQPGGEIRAPAPHLQPFRPWHNSFFLLPVVGRFLHDIW